MVEASRQPLSIAIMEEEKYLLTWITMNVTKQSHFLMFVVTVLKRGALLLFQRA